VADWTVLTRAATAAARGFAAGLVNPGQRQRALLNRILGENTGSEIGKRYGFAAIGDFHTWCAQVPVQDYAGLVPDIARVAAGEDGVLTAETVIAFEETGGTGAGTKLIPYTASGLADFRGAVLPWLGDLIARRPALGSGRAYVTISPATRAPRSTAGGVPIGLGSDAAYLGEDLAPHFGGLLAVPADVGALTSFGEWQVATLAALISAPDLSFVSLWSPTFLLALLGALEPQAEAVLARVDRPTRARLEAALVGRALDTATLWPHLDCISCWTDGVSAAYARQLGALFPQAAIEGKGLLATEAAVTVPWGDGGHCIPAIDSCVIEFHEPAGRAHLCDTLRPGEVYRTVITTRSGLYRYDLGDLVECTGHLGAAPLLRFLGRAGMTSDLVGEKLDDTFVAAALAQLGSPAVLVAREQPSGYVLIAEHSCGDAAATVENALMRNPQYAYARGIGQLAPLEVVYQPQLSGHLNRAGLDRGQRLGDLKPVALVPNGPTAKDWLTL